MNEDEGWFRAVVDNFGEDYDVHRNWQGHLTINADDQLEVQESAKAHKQLLRTKAQEQLRGNVSLERDRHNQISLLCTAHRDIELQDIRWPVRIGDIFSILSNSHCPLCRLVRFLLITNVKDQLQEDGCWMSCKLAPFPARLKSKSCSTWEQGPDAERQPKILHLFLDDDERGFRNTCVQPGPMTLQPFNCDNSRSACFQVRRLGDHARMDQCRRWLEECCSAKTLPAEPAEGNDEEWVNQSVLVFDVRKRCSVPMPVGCKYAALSYVWGGAHHQPYTLTKKSGVYERSGSVDAPSEGGLAATIEDAIDVCLHLGFMYLWADVLCIFQDDPAHIRAQIALMHKIYSQATLTIISAGGGHAQVGLLGAPRRSRPVLQHIDTVGDQQWATVMSGSEDAISQSVWATRAWTFQERQLSKRCLIFTKYQVFFQCSHSSYSEDTCSELTLEKIWNPVLRSAFLQMDRPPSSSIGVFSFVEYARVVHDFSGKEVTNFNDRLNAFEGIAQALMAMYKIRFTYGLPGAYLEVALLWSPVSHHRDMRAEPPSPKTSSALDSDPQTTFPTWCWANWQGQVQYDANLELESTYSKIMWSDRSLQDRLSTRRSLLHNNLVHHGRTGELQFRTSLAKFNLVLAEHTQRGKDMSRIFPRTPSRSSIASALIVDDQGVHAGEILLDLRSTLLPPQHIEGHKHEFVLVAQVKDAERVYWQDGYGGRNQETFVFDEPPPYAPDKQPKEVLPKETKPWSYYKVILVRRLQTGFARVAAGTIDKGAWETHKQSDTTITLI